MFILLSIKETSTTTSSRYFLCRSIAEASPHDVQDSKNVDSNPSKRDDDVNDDDYEAENDSDDEDINGDGKIKKDETTDPSLEKKPVFKFDTPEVNTAKSQSKERSLEDDENHGTKNKVVSSFWEGQQSKRETDFDDNSDDNTDGDDDSSSDNG